MSNDGPTLKLNASCFDCKWCKSASYTCQGDSGFDIYCEHQQIKTANRSIKYIGMNWTTPKWCPLLPDMVAKFANSLKEDLKNDND